jgi:hypothetical protein
LADGEAIADFDGVRTQALSLSRADKYRLVHALVADLASGDCTEQVPADEDHRDWTPLDAAEAKEVLRQLIDTTADDKG